MSVWNDHSPAIHYYPLCSVKIGNVLHNASHHGSCECCFIFEMNPCDWPVGVSHTHSSPNKPAGS